MNLPNDVVLLQRELHLCVDLILQVTGSIEGDSPREIVGKFIEMYLQEYRANGDMGRGSAILPSDYRGRFSIDWGK